LNRVFVDTSAFLALLIREDEAHSAARRVFAGLRQAKAVLVTTSYVLVETYALLGRRVGVDAVRAFRNDFAPLLSVVWVDAAMHESALDLLIERSRRQLSLVDAVSFLASRDRRITRVFAFDPHFEDEGFELLVAD
jgi:uncharacterized protein